MMLAHFISSTWLHKDINVFKNAESKAMRKEKWEIIKNTEM